MSGPTGAPGPPDLIGSTAALIDISSVSFEEGELADEVERRLLAVAESRVAGRFEVIRHGDNVVARTLLGRERRVVLAGHLDTVPANGNERSSRDGERLRGLGAADMKSGLAIMLDLAERISEPEVDVTWVFYAREEVAAEHSGLLELRRYDPALLLGDLALLGEPTDGVIEAGCQGSIRAEIDLGGQRAHTARAWMGVNAIHRGAELLSRLSDWRPRRPVVEGCEYREALQAVAVSGGVAGNVVPDRMTLTLAHRFAPDRSVDEAEQWLRGWLEPSLDPGDVVRIVDRADAARPGLGDPLLRGTVERHGLDVRAKLGWTDAAFFAALGIPAANFGPGDPVVAHTAEEFVTRGSLEQVWRVLHSLLTEPPGAG